MLFDETQRYFMSLAFKEALKAFDDDEVPVGAVVVCNNRVIGRGYNQNERLKDSTAHAEIIAITAACNYLSDNKLPECDLYVTLEPCLMCAGAIVLARIRTLYFAAYEPKTGACGSLYNVVADPRLNHVTKTYGGLEEEASKLLLSDFFRKKRSN